ncbi:ParA family protein [Vibrio furnissii]|uniref:ParA family protein n=1 Tax=Vibrio furnissii TaxID=29494 RepID=UPI001EEACED7|nr:ParA family protein [Vibrio furnissii]MCG6268280.1 ParA family protein [Vibrio furnissii]
MIIAVGHNKGGVGKSTIALNIAAVIRPDIVIDQDTHQSIVVLNQLRESDPFNVVTIDNRNTLIDYLKQSDQGKTILVDCGGFDSDLNRMAIAAADLVIIPANDDTTELIGLRNFETVLAQISQEMDTHITGHVLFNRVHPNRRRFDAVEDFLSNAQHMTRLETIIPRYQQIPDAIAYGLGVTEMKATKYSTASRKIQNLVTEVKQLTGLN